MLINDETLNVVEEITILIMDAVVPLLHIFILTWKDPGQWFPVVAISIFIVVVIADLTDPDRDDKERKRKEKEEKEEKERKEKEEKEEKERKEKEEKERKEKERLENFVRIAKVIGLFVVRIVHQILKFIFGIASFVTLK